ncbi:hypothetical protein NEHOM01_1770 [Nematocida homosporus]|uniref:uncharacterized protein n=1 Tax=Nematocida homosporus TaxID=1912981 RepID=UPI002220FF0E|nr:uncharacterized protein NEHOM01_1770 [Nematocida homosporus]KAI5186881.1 hypothetical protein NEHOM01_1770 [Nematocida homosporus]
MDTGPTLLPFQIIQTSEINELPPVEPLIKIAKSEAFNKKPNFYELSQPHEYSSSYRLATFGSHQLYKDYWKGIDFFPQIKHVDYTRLQRPPICQNLMAVNRTPEKGSPYLMYSNDGYKYFIRKERHTDGIDVCASIFLNEIPTKVSLYKNNSLVLTRTGVDIIDCNTLKTYTIPIDQPFDMATPFGNTSFLCVLKEPACSSNTDPNYYNAILDQLDLESGKAISYTIKGHSAFSTAAKISSTWHPQQYICGRSMYISLLDLREKTSRSIWTIAPKLESLHPDRVVKSGTINSLEQATSNKIVVSTGSHLGTLDMRWLNDMFSSRYVPFRAEGLAAGHNVVAYNALGQFFFESLSASEPYAYRHFKLPTTTQFLAFDWHSRSFTKPYSFAAFLFDTHIIIHHHDGQTNLHQIPSAKPADIVFGLAGAKDIVQQNRRIRKRSSALNTFLGRTKSLFATTTTTNKPDSYTYLERSLLGGHGDPLKPKPPLNTTIPRYLAQIWPASSFGNKIGNNPANTLGNPLNTPSTTSQPSTPTNTPTNTPNNTPTNTPNTTPNITPQSSPIMSTSPSSAIELAKKYNIQPPGEHRSLNSKTPSPPKPN